MKQKIQKINTPAYKVLDELISVQISFVQSKKNGNEAHEALRKWENLLDTLHIGINKKENDLIAHIKVFSREDYNTLSARFYATTKTILHKTKEKQTSAIQKIHSFFSSLRCCNKRDDTKEEFEPLIPRLD